MSSIIVATTAHTIGYQGITIDRFMAKLREEGIDTIIDVRANPVSRKPGFSKSALIDRLTREGIAYNHFPELGISSHYRNKIRNHNDLFLIYETDILPNHPEKVSQVADLCREGRAALLCFEANPAECHRSRLAKHISGLHDTKFRHIRF